MSEEFVKKKGIRWNPEKIRRNNIRKTLQRLVNYRRIPESLEEVNDILEDIIDVLIDMNGLKKTRYTESPDIHFEEKENEE